MNRYLKRITSAFLIMCMMLPAVSLAGCSKKKQQTTVSDLPSEITADMPWYESTVTYVSTDIDPYQHEYMFTKLIGCVSDRVIVRSYGQQIMDPLDFTGNLFTERLQIYDFNGELMHEIDTLQAISEYEPEATGIYIEDVLIKNGEAALKIRKTENGVFRYEYLYLDPVTGDFTGSDPIDSTIDSQYSTDLFLWDIDEWTVQVSVLSLPDGSAPGYVLNVSRDGGAYETLDLEEQMPMISIAAVYDYIYLGEGQMLLKLINYSMDRFVCLVDLNTMTARDIRSDASYDWTDDVDILRYSYYGGIGNVAVDRDGIKILDLDTKTADMYLSFDNCDLNRFDAAGLWLLSMSDDRIVLGGISYRCQDFEIPGSSTAMIVVLRPCDSNPNAGKKVISAAGIGRLSYPVCEAIRQFNDGDNGAFIMFDKRYDHDTVADSIVYETDMDEETYELEVTASIMSQLSLDLLAGEGPDIILGAIDYRQLDDPSLLLDLSTDVTDQSLYSNVMDLASVGGALYQVPLAFGLEGILVKDADVDPSAVGFTYDSYDEYISGPCNGVAPIRMTKLTFMCNCLTEMSSAFADGNGYNFRSDAFVNAAEFTSRQILPDELEPEMIQLQYTGVDPYASSFINATSAMDLVNQTHGWIDSMRMMGFPSADGSGLLINVSDSVAVSAATACEADCRRFVQMLVSQEIQQMFAENCGISVNCDAQETACALAASRNNQWYDALKVFYSPENLAFYNYPQSSVDPDLLIEQMNGYISSASGIRMMDAPVEIIIREEIQAYFAGQKTIDETMELIQNRVNTFVNERG